MCGVCGVGYHEDGREGGEEEEGEEEDEEEEEKEEEEEEEERESPKVRTPHKDVGKKRQSQSNKPAARASIQVTGC